jgi:NADPH-dependent F420 reductase
MSFPPSTHREDSVFQSIKIPYFPMPKIPKIPDTSRFPFLIQWIQLTLRRTTMNIGIIGTGNMGFGLGRLWASRGHAVFFGSRDPEKALRLGNSIGVMSSGGTIAKAAKFGSVILLEVSWDHVRVALQAAGSLEGKIIIDCTNPTTSDWTQLLEGLTSSGGERIAELAPGAKVVKAFNHVYAQIIQSSPMFGTQNASVLYCGDDEAAKEKVACLIEDAGFDPIDSGALQNARCLEPIAEQMMHFAYVIGMGTDQALKIIRR